jgi:hypothetical protein
MESRNKSNYLLLHAVTYVGHVLSPPSVQETPIRRYVDLDGSERPDSRFSNCSPLVKNLSIFKYMSSSYSNGYTSVKKIKIVSKSVTY